MVGGAVGEPSLVSTEEAMDLASCVRAAPLAIVMRSVLVPMLRRTTRGNEDAAESLDRLEAGIGFASELLARFELQTVVSVSKPEPRRRGRR
jgi:hypothetical protein